jgi:hypothetical protein
MRKLYELLVFPNNITTSWNRRNEIEAALNTLYDNNTL